MALELSELPLSAPCSARRFPPRTPPSGLDLAYRVADEVFEPKALNRLILCSDGVANVGAHGPQEILR